MRSATRVLIVVVSGLALLGASRPGRAVRYGLALAPGDPAPQIALPLLSGGGERYEHAFSDHAFTLVNFWATWCKPCREEMPALQRLLDKHRGDGLEVVGILFDPRSDEVGAKRYLEEVGARYSVIRGNLETLQSWGGIGMFPTTFLVGRDGKIVRRYVGASPAQLEGLVQDVEAVLAGRALGSMVMPEAPADRPQP